MTRGYLILAQNAKDHNYVKFAYALALSIKGTQSTVNNVSLVTNLSRIPKKYREVFDKILPIPWNDSAAKSDWKIENKWKYFHMTPYDETIVLDADMIFPQDISHWWDVLSQKEVWITTNPRTFKGDIIKSTYHRKTFISNNLPNIYTAFMYFKKTKMSAEMFKMTEIIFNNWERFYYNYLETDRPKFLSGDVAYAMAIKMLGIEDECTGNLESLPTFTHMRGLAQDIGEDLINAEWPMSIPTYYSDDCSFKIGNYQQTLPFHYHIKTWLTDDIIEKLEKKINL